MPVYVRELATGRDDTWLFTVTEPAWDDSTEAELHELNDFTEELLALIQAHGELTDCSIAYSRGCANTFDTRNPQIAAMIKLKYLDASDGTIHSHRI